MPTARITSKQIIQGVQQDIDSFCKCKKKIVHQLKPTDKTYEYEQGQLQALEETQLYINALIEDKEIVCCAINQLLQAYSFTRKVL